MLKTSAEASGFFARSLSELKRRSEIILGLQAIKGNPAPLTLQAFTHPSKVLSCQVMSDEDFGGFSRISLTWASPDKTSHQPPRTDAPGSSVPSGGYAVFSGHIATKLPQDRLEIQRSGFAGWKTQDRDPTIFGRSLWDVDPYAYLALRVKSDGRSYFINVQTESLVPSDLHQHRLFAKRPGEWETVIIRWSDFVRTNHGYVVEPQTELLRKRVKSIGLGLTDRVPGPFELCIEKIWATNKLADGEEPPPPNNNNNNNSSSSSSNNNNDDDDNNNKKPPSDGGQEAGCAGSYDEGLNDQRLHDHHLRNRHGGHVSWTGEDPDETPQRAAGGAGG